MKIWTCADCGKQVKSRTDFKLHTCLSVLDGRLVEVKAEVTWSWGSDNFILSLVAIHVIMFLLRNVSLNIHIRGSHLHSLCLCERIVDSSRCSRRSPPSTWLSQLVDSKGSPVDSGRPTLFSERSTLIPDGASWTKMILYWQAEWKSIYRADPGLIPPILLTTEPRELAPEGRADNRAGDVEPTFALSVNRLDLT